MQKTAFIYLVSFYAEVFRQFFNIKNSVPQAQIGWEPLA